MQNINYDLVKLLHTLLDIEWRLTKYYVADAKKAKCHSLPALERILKHTQKHIEMVRKELAMRAQAGVFD